MGLRSVAFVSALLLAFTGANADFTIQERPGRVAVYEDGKPVLVYNVDSTEPPEGVDPKYRRSSYIHPLFNVDGEIVTQDYPSDHYHHRGIFWGWPESSSNGRKMDIWTIAGAHQVFERWLEQDAQPNRATLTVQNAWVFDDQRDPIVRETITMQIYASEDRVRAIDFDLRFKNVSSDPFVLLGATGKGYGGFNVRPDAHNKPFSFTTAEGPLEEDALSIDSPWADVSWSSRDTDGDSGMAVFQHPSNPDFPHDGWLLRHYGLLGAAWPHETPYTIAPGASVELKYRLVVHAGDAADAHIGQRFQEYLREATK
jgi:hypothetical protein